MDEFFSGLNCRLRVSGLVADSIMMGIVNSTMEEAYDKVCSKKGDLERLNEKSRFCELAIMQLEWCLKFIQEEVDIYVVDSSQQREELVSELTDTRDRIRKRLEETEFAIKKKDKELKERMENELRLRQALESKVGELASLRVTLELEKTRSDRVREFVHSNQIRGEDSDTGFCELKNSLDQQFWNIKRKLEDGRVHSTDEVQKLHGCSNTLKLEADALEPEFELVGEGSGSYNIDDKNFSLKSEEVQNHCCKQTGFLENDNDSRVEVLNCCVQTEVTDRNLEFEQMGTDIDILKEMLEVGFEMMDNTISLSKVGLLEQQWEWSVQKEMVGLVLRGFLRDVEENFKTKYLEGHKDAIQSLVGDYSPSLIGGIKSLRHELEQLLVIQTEVPSIPPICSHESGIPSSSSSHVDFGGMGISQNHTSLNEKSVDTKSSGGDPRKYPTNALRRCGKSDTSLKFQELCHLEDLPEQDSAPHSNHHVAKMIRNHEYFTKKKTEEIEEIDCLKGEILREKGRCHFRKDKAFNHVKKLIPDIILRLDRIIQECATSGVNLDDYEKGEFSLQKTLSGSILAEEEKVAEAPEKQGNAKVSHSVDAASIEEIKQLKHAREEFNIQTMIAEELHMILFKGFVEQMYHEVESNEMENLIKEDLYAVSLKEIVREWNNDRESYITESLIRDEIYQIVFSEVIKDINCSVTLPNCQESWNQDTTLEDLPLASFLLEISKRNHFMQEQGSELNTSEAVDDFMILNTELVETDKHFDIGDWKLEELDEESFLQDDAFDSVKSKLENALQQIIMSKLELRELGCSLGIAVGSPEEANHQMALIEGIAQDMPNGEKQWNALESIVTPLKDFSRAITDFEHIIHEKQGFHITRLDKAKRQLDQLIQHVPSIKAKELLYRKAFLRRCYNLQTAEAEVDLLGDKVDALLCLLEKIYAALYRYSPVLQHYFGIMDILKLIRKELNGEAAPTNPQQLIDVYKHKVVSVAASDINSAFGPKYIEVNVIQQKSRNLQLHQNYALCSLSGMFNLPACDSTSPSPKLSSLGDLDCFKSRTTKVTAAPNGELGVPTFTYSQDVNAQKPRKQRLAVIVGAGVGATMLVATVIIIVCFCLTRARRLARRTSDTGSSESSSYVDGLRGNVSPHVGNLSSSEVQDISQLTLAELRIATSNFSQSNIIGEGGFGLVYKGLLQDGSIVAIKRRFHDPSQYFAQEVQNLGQIRHRHIVKLIGYCQENREQLLIYDYMANGNVGNHLYDSEGLPIGKLDICRRLSIALGAARGLEFLHILVPPFLHMHFRTCNVHLDENFTAKVADVGLSRFLIGSYRAGPSSGIDCFCDPELSISNGFSERTDVYGFGVFLLELISGREAVGRTGSVPGQNLIEWAKSTNDLNSFVDPVLRKDQMEATQLVMELALQCVGIGEKRPTMMQIVATLELIHEREMGHLKTKGLDEEIGVVTLGSELFK